MLLCMYCTVQHLSRKGREVRLLTSVLRAWSWRTGSGDRLGIRTVRISLQSVSSNNIKHWNLHPGACGCSLCRLSVVWASCFAAIVQAKSRWKINSCMLQNGLFKTNSQRSLTLTLDYYHTADALSYRPDLKELCWITSTYFAMQALKGEEGLPLWCWKG